MPGRAVLRRYADAVLDAIERTAPFSSLTRGRPTTAGGLGRTAQAGRPTLAGLAFEPLEDTHTIVFTV